jgi:hypothetical protein
VEEDEAMSVQLDYIEADDARNLDEGDTCFDCYFYPKCAFESGVMPECTKCEFEHNYFVRNCKPLEEK